MPEKRKHASPLFGTCAVALLALLVAQTAFMPAARAQDRSRAAPATASATSAATPAEHAQLRQIYEPSAVQQLPDGRLLVVEDEAKRSFSVLRINADNTLLEDAAATQALRQSIRGELSDLEALAQDAKGRFYAATSHSEVKANQGGGRRAQRERLVRFAISNNRIQEMRDGPNLKEALQQSAVVQQAVQSQAGGPADFSRLNLEGMAYNPQSKQLLLGLREPQVKAGSKVLSLILSINNPDALFDSGAAPEFGEVFAFDLKGSGIRSLAYHAPSKTYLITNESFKTESDKPTSQLWLWDGRAQSAPRKVHLPEIDALKNAEAVTVAQIRGKPHLLVLGDNGSSKKQRGASYFIIDASRILPPASR
ncbi:MAG: DUF3616 domain-containing protein [Brachymonas sp.]|nr:DUF3616 domain-containing protein [Brachymonas sp.]